MRTFWWLMRGALEVYGVLSGGWWVWRFLRRVFGWKPRANNEREKADV